MRKTIQRAIGVSPLKETSMYVTGKLEDHGDVRHKDEWEYVQRSKIREILKGSCKEVVFWKPKQSLFFFWEHWGITKDKLGMYWTKSAEITNEPRAERHRETFVLMGMWPTGSTTSPAHAKVYVTEK